MKIKSIRIEDLGLDIEKIGQRDLEDIARFIEQIIIDELNRLLGPRILEYITTINIEIDNNMLNISIDLEADSYLIPHTSLDKILDKVLRYVFTKTEMYLSTRFRGTKESFDK